MIALSTRRRAILSPVGRRRKSAYLWLCIWVETSCRTTRRCLCCVRNLPAGVSFFW